MPNYTEFVLLITPTRLLALSVLLLNGFFLQAQQDFRPGFIVTTASDTVRGEVDYRGNAAMNEVCRFRTEGQKPVEYAPGNIAAYGLSDGRLFVSDTVDGDPLFLERLTSGRISLYSYRNEIYDYYLIEKSGLGLSKLEYRESERWVNGKRVINQSRSHILLLNYYMQDWPEAPAVTEDLGQPRRDNLLRLLEQYHAAVNPVETFEILEDRIPLIVLTPELVAGYNRYHEVLTLMVDNYTRFGAIAHIWMPRVNRKLYFRTGVLYSRFELEATTRSYYKFPVHLEYIYPSRTLRPRISYGHNFNNLTGGTVSGNLGIMARLANRIFLTADYEIEFDEQFVVIPVEFLSHAISVGIAVRLHGQ